MVGTASSIVEFWVVSSEIQDNAFSPGIRIRLAQSFTESIQLHTRLLPCQKQNDAVLVAFLDSCDKLVTDIEFFVCQVNQFKTTKD